MTKLSTILSILVLVSLMPSAYSYSEVRPCDDGSPPVWIYGKGVICNPSSVDLFFDFIVSGFNDLIEKFTGKPLFVILPSAYADSFLEPKENFIFGIKNFVQDVIITITPEENRGQVIAEFAREIQTTIDDKSKHGEVISLDLEERRKELLNTEVRIGGFSGRVIDMDNIRSEIESIADMNQIRILYSQFPDCIESCTPEQKDIFNNKVNSLDSWQDKCSGIFDIDDYTYSTNSFDDLSDKCPDLKNYSHKHLKTIITGKI